MSSATPLRGVRGPFVALILAAGGCSNVEFYSQAVVGQVEVLAKRRTVEEVMEADPDGALADRLRLTRRLLDFAEEELLMPSGGSYELYAAVEREHLVWVIHAAPELSLEAKRWWYPVVGCLAYRGYFREDLARKEADRLRSQGYDVWLGGVDAFSTLGVFRDPVLDTFAGREEVDYAELILHELAHRKYFRSGDTGFSEALAEAVAREGMRRWFRHTGRPELVERYDVRLRKLAAARAAIGGTSERLRALYASGLPEETMRASKADEIARLKRGLRDLRQEWGGGLKSWIDGPVNNARLNSFTTYEAGVPRFTRLIEECDGDFACFWERVPELGS